MLARFFEKTNPIIYLLISVVLLICGLVFNFYHAQTINGVQLFKTLGVFAILLVGLIINERICHKKDITKNNSYAFLIAVMLMLMIPGIFVDWQVVMSVILVLFGFNLLLNLDYSKQVKRNLFDASFLILGGVIFEFWASIFMVMIYVAIFTLLQRDYRNWLVPLVSLLFVAIIFVTLGEIFEFNYKDMFLSQLKVKFKLDIFESTNEHIGFSFLSAFALIFLFQMFSVYSSKSQKNKDAYRKLMFFVLFGFMLFAISSQKQATQLLFIVYPVSILGANYLENIRDIKYRSFVLWMLILFAFLMFFNQLIN